MINTIIYDLGGVVVYENQDLWKSIFSDLLNTANTTKIDLETLKSHLVRYKSDIQTGKMKLYDFYQKVLNSVQENNINPKELLQIHLFSYIKHSGKYDKDMLKLISHLRKKYCVICFTNTEPEIATLNKKRGLFDYFERAFISSKMGLKKPDLKSYRKVLNELRIKPQQAIFVDNDQNNVKAAKKIGVNGIVYQDINHLKREFISLGVDTY